jgi:branched-chain amino acid transport system permease protein
MNWTSIAQYSVDALSLGGLYALFALGIALIFGILQLINFAHGELIMIGGFSLVLTDSLPLATRVLVAIGAVCLAALITERVAFRPVRGASPATLLVTSFAVSYFLQNLAVVVMGSLPKSASLTAFLTDALTIGSVTILNVDAVTIGVTAVLLVALVAFLRKTAPGRQMRAAAEDFTMARLCGVRANRIVALAFAISGLLAVTAAMLLVAQTGVVSPTMGLNPVLIAFIATILGGMGSLSGAVLGGLILGVLSTVFQAFLPFELRPYRDAFTYTAVFLMLIMRPQGLVVARAAIRRV